MGKTRLRALSAKTANGRVWRLLAPRCWIFVTRICAAPVAFSWRARACLAKLISACAPTSRQRLLAS